MVLNNEKKCGIVSTEIEPGTDFWKITYNDNKIVIGLFLYKKHEDYISRIEENPKIEEIINNENDDYEFNFEKEEFISNFINEIENNIDKYNDNYLKTSLNGSRKIDDLKNYITNIKETLSKN